MGRNTMGFAKLKEQYYNRKKDNKINKEISKN